MQWTVGIERKTYDLIWPDSMLLHSIHRRKMNMKCLSKLAQTSFRLRGRKIPRIALVSLKRSSSERTHLAPLIYAPRTVPQKRELTGPVNTLLDLVDHVPTN